MNASQIKKAIAVITLGTISSLAQAASTGGTFNVTATVNPNCTVSGSNIGLGSITPGSTTGTVTQSGTVSATCTNSTTYSISASNAAFLTGSSTSYQLNYSLDKSSLPTNATGAGFGAAAQTYNVSASIAKTDYDQAKPDSYSDTVTLTLTY